MEFGGRWFCKLQTPRPQPCWGASEWLQGALVMSWRMRPRARSLPSCHPLVGLAGRWHSSRHHGRSLTSNAMSRRCTTDSSAAEPEHTKTCVLLDHGAVNSQFCLGCSAQLGGETLMTESCSQEIKHERKELRPRAIISPRQQRRCEQAGGSCVGQGVTVPWGAKVSRALCFPPTMASPSCVLRARDLRFAFNHTSQPR